MERPDQPAPCAAKAAVEGHHTPGWDRGATLCLVLLLLVALTSLVWFSHPYLDPRNDACMYILLARNLLGGEGYSLLGQPFALRPPGFSAMLVPLLSIWGTDLRVLNLFVGLFGVACIAFLFVLLRRRTGSTVALVLSVLLWFNPGFRTFSAQVMSDVPGIALALGCLLLERRWRGRSPAHGFWLGTILGLCTLVRSMNLLLAPAILLAALLRRTDLRRRLAHGALLLLGCAAVLTPWSLRNARADLPAPTEQTSIYSYGTGMFHVDPSDPASERLAWCDVAARIPRQVARVAHALGARMVPGGKPRPIPMGLAALGLACVVFIAFRRREPAEFLCLGLLAVVSLYFAFVDRLVLPVFVLALPAVGEVSLLAAQRLWARLLSHSTSTPSSAPVWTVAALFLALALADARDIPGAAPLRSRSIRMHSLVESLEQAVPPGRPLAARLGWELGVYMEERAVYSLFVVAKRAERAGMLEMLDRHGVEHAVFHQPTPDDRTLRKALGGIFKPAATFGDWRLVQR